MLSFHRDSVSRKCLSNSLINIYFCYTNDFLKKQISFHNHGRGAGGSNRLLFLYHSMGGSDEKPYSKFFSEPIC